MAAEKSLQDAFDLLCTTSGAKDGKLALSSIEKWFKQSAVTGKDRAHPTDTEVARGRFRKSRQGQERSDFQ
ncbi:hypothetical protein HNY73_019826 [Argiope bruennichi]|uniref:Uncharacterized protein n=1 Tax=Argiope bruennichi TaxID=94029 RepID=A0A8T0E5Y2_ARGBR|nr:hypothetical protein HNY73_019826 [Argiope bruennichi]